MRISTASALVVSMLLPPFTTNDSELKVALCNRFCEIWAVLAHKLLVWHVWLGGMCKGAAHSAVKVRRAHFYHSGANNCSKPMIPPPMIPGMLCTYAGCMAPK